MSSLKTHRAIRNMELDLNLSERDMYCDDFSPEKSPNHVTETYPPGGFKSSGEIYYNRQTLEIQMVENKDLPLFLTGLWFNRNYE